MEMTAAEQKFALAAFEVFKRWGVRKTTMEEIAAAAGVSKPTLYSTFRNKDAALAGTIRLAKGAAIAEVRASWSSLSDLDAKLDVFFDIMVIRGFDLLHAAPDSDAFSRSIGIASDEAIRDTDQSEMDLIAEALQGSALETLGTTPQAYAEFIVRATMCAKNQIPTRDKLLNFLAELKRSILATVG